MIQFREVVVRYPGRSAPVLDGVTLAVPRGEITAVVGPNGSGKSTLVRALLQRVPLSSGSISVDDVEISAQARRALATRVSVMAQREEVTFPLRVIDYVKLGLFPRVGMWGSGTLADLASFDNAIAVAEVESLLDRSVTEVSGGEWQRIRLARALAQGGDALVLDEPTTFLDIGHEMAMFELLETLRRSNKAILLISHHLNLVARFATTMHLLANGTIQASGPPGVVMEAELLRRIYEWPMQVDHVNGAPSLTPMRRNESR